MPSPITYIIVPFLIDRKGKLKPGSPLSMKDREKAVIAAERICIGRAGVVVIEQEADVAADLYAEPKLVAAFGHVPENMIESLAA
jgi:hypothetical protein